MLAATHSALHLDAKQDSTSSIIVWSMHSNWFSDLIFNSRFSIPNNSSELSALSSSEDDESLFTIFEKQHVAKRKTRRGFISVVIIWLLKPLDN